MDSIIETPRLRLTRLTNTDFGSRDLDWFHQNWSDETATGWSIHGACKTIEESRDFMMERIESLDDMFYAVHVKRSTEKESPEEDRNVAADADAELGEMLGSISLRVNPSGVDSPPPPHPDLSTGSNKTLHARTIGYAFFHNAWGHGYATETVTALYSAYSRYRSHFPDEVSYIEAGVSEENPASIRVLEKAGMKRVGRKELAQGAFLAGAWRDAWYWVYGMYT